MQPILFYGVPEGCSFGSIVALEWIGRPYRLCRIVMPEVVSSDAYRRINPVGETPALLTANGTILSESLAILNHLAPAGIDKGLAFPQGSADFDRLNQMLAFLNTSFFESFSPLWHALEHGGEDVEVETLRRYGRQKVEKAHADLKRLLGDRPWLLGDRRTLADAYFAGIARWSDFHRVVDRSTYPALARLYAKLQDDPAVRFAHAIEEQHEVQGSGTFAGHVGLDEALGLIEARAGTP